MTNVRRFPIGLLNHWRKCEWDGCSLCNEYIDWIHAWQRRCKDQDKILKRTIDDVLCQRLNK